LRFCLTDTAPPALYTLSLHDALPILRRRRLRVPPAEQERPRAVLRDAHRGVALPALVLAADRAHHARAAAVLHQHPLRVPRPLRSEEHTSELQSQSNLVCRLLLEKKK